MSIEVRKEVAFFGIPLWRRTQMQTGDYVITRNPFETEKRDMLVIARGDSLRFNSSEENEICIVSREQMKGGLVLPGKHGTRFSFRLKDKRKKV